MVLPLFINDRLCTIMINFVDVYHSIYNGNLPGLAGKEVLKIWYGRGTLFGGVPKVKRKNYSSLPEYA